MSRSPVAGCTIATRHQLPEALSLFDAFHRFHPDSDFHVLLVSETSPEVERHARLKVIRPGDLRESLPRFRGLVFQHGARGAALKLRPFFLKHLIESEGASSLLLLAPDLVLLGPLSLMDAPAPYGIMATEPRPSEAQNPRKSGLTPWLSFSLENSDYVRLDAGASVKEWLDWWSALSFCPQLLKARDFALPPESVFQSFRHEPRNLRITRAWLGSGSTRYEVERSAQRELLCLEQRDLAGSAARSLPPGIRKVAQEQFQQLFHHGALEAKDWPEEYASFFDDGTPIPPIARKIYSDSPETRGRFANPFETGKSDCFRDWLLRAPSNGKLSPLLQTVWRSRADLQKAYPRPEGADRSAFLRWVVAEGTKDFSLTGSFARWLQSELSQSSVPRKRRDEFHLGVTLSGYFHSATGMGTASRSDLACLRRAQVPVRLDTALLDVSSFQVETSGPGSAPSGPFPFNLLHVNAEALPEFIGKKDPGFFERRYNIASCVWELEQMHPIDPRVFRVLSEIWTPSSFSQHSISKISPVPVIRIPHSIPDDFGTGVRPLAREVVGAGKEDFIFLFCFNFCSYFERKNPLALVRAFKEAFRASDRVTLVIKTMGGAFYPRELSRLVSEASGHRIRIIDAVWKSQKVLQLMKLADCYVSLHRSEGFGLTLLESMALEKPVIGTAYSGNMDFMSQFNSYLIPATLRELDRDVGPYRAGSAWAEPSLEDAVRALRKVRDNREEAALVAKRARHEIMERYSASKVAPLYRARLATIAESRLQPDSLL